MSMNLYDLCIQVLVRPEVIEKHLDDLDMIPVNIKSSLFKILSKRGYLSDLKLFRSLVNPYITKIDLSECVVCDDYLYCLYKCKNLKVLDLSLRRRQKREVTTDALITLFGNLPRLRVIALPHCKEVTDDVIQAICNTCTSLVELHIPHSSITDSSLRLMGMTLKRLSVMNLLGTQVTDSGVESLLQGELRHWLREVNIDKCPNITLLSSQIIDQNCPNIKIFTCGGFNDYEEYGSTMDRIRSKAKQNGSGSRNRPWVYIFFVGDAARSQC